MHGYIFYSPIICTWEKLYQALTESVSYGTTFQWLLRDLPTNGIYNFKAMLIRLVTIISIFSLFTKFFSTTLTICCHLSSALSIGTLVMKVCNAGTLSFQRSDSSKTATIYIFLLHYTRLPLDQPFESLFLPKFFNFLYLSIYVSGFSQHLLSHHFIPSIPQVTMKHDLKPAFYFLTSKTKTTYKQNQKKKRGSFSNYFWTINKAYFSRGESFNLLFEDWKNGLSTLCARF